MIWRALAIFALGGFGITAGALGTWTADRTTPVDVVKVSVLTPQVNPGGELKVEYHVYRRASCRTHLERVLFDSKNVRVPLDPIDFMASPGPIGDETYTSAIKVPRNFAQGRGGYRAITSYICNPVHSLWPIVTVAGDVKFIVAGDPVNEPLIEVIPRK